MPYKVNFVRVKNQRWYAVDKAGNEFLCRYKPTRGKDAWIVPQAAWKLLFQGSIERITGKRMTWADEPLEWWDGKEREAQPAPQVSLENWLRDKLHYVETMHDYAVATETVRVWIDQYNESRPSAPQDLRERAEDAKTATSQQFAKDQKEKESDEVFKMEPRFKPKNFVLLKSVHWFGRVIPAGTIYKQVNPDHWYPVINYATCPSLQLDFRTVTNNSDYFLEIKP